MTGSILWKHRLHLAVALLSGAQAFFMSCIPKHTLIKSARVQAQHPHVRTIMLFTDLTDPAKMLGRAAEFGLKLKLKSNQQVEVSVQGTTADIMRGSVVGVVVRGKAWASPRKLTCRSLFVEVSETAIDTDALLTKGRIDLMKPALGVCNVVFNSGLVHALEEFFNTLTVDLDGARLRFSKMTFPDEHPGCVLIQLDIEVVKFPNPLTTSF